MRAVSIFAGCLLSTSSFRAVAAADTVGATRYEIIERAHTIEMKVDRGFATLVVQRVVANSGPKSDQATFHLDLPDTAVATRLRTAGVDAKGQTIWFEGELMEAEAAAKKYEELTGIGGYYPKDPALLSWRSQGNLALQVFPVPPQSTKTVEYTLKMPLTYDHGAYHVELPPIGTDGLPARVHITAAHPEDSVTVNGIAASAGGAAGGGITARAEKNISIELRPRGVVGDRHARSLRWRSPTASISFADGSPPRRTSPRFRTARTSSSFSTAHGRITTRRPGSPQCARISVT